jgi:hypothetical protein
MPNLEEVKVGAMVIEAAVGEIKGVAQSGGLSFASIFAHCEKVALKDAGMMRSMLMEKGLVSGSSDSALMDASKVLKLEPHWSCENVNDAARSVSDVTTQLGRHASLRWNGIDVAVAPGDSPQTIRTAYDAGWDAVMKTPERVEFDRLLVARHQAEVEKWTADNKKSVEGVLGTPGRSESELIAELESGAKARGSHWMMYAIASLRNPAEMKTAANYYAHESPTVAAKNIAFAIGKWTPPGTEAAWRDVLAQMPKLSAS